MAFRRICIGAAGALAAFLMAAPAGADDVPLGLQTAEPAAAAADALPEAPDLDAIPFFAAGDNAFYLRADAGFGALTAGSALTANGRFNPGLSGPFIAGAGVGYRFGYVLRADVTAEYRSRADIHTADGVRARLSGATVLANLYADIGTWHGVTPYVGAGAGVAWNRLAGAFGDRDRTNFAWALGGGFAVEVTPQVSLDISYRYLHTGAVRSPTLALRESGSHDVRIGLRWWFGKAAAGDLP
ncbi:outer membrane protein [Pseudochelatococcus sp. B33]